MDQARQVDGSGGSGASSRMVFIPAGVFQMGDGSKKGWAVERPVHHVNVGPFFIDRYLITRRLWREVFDWAQCQRYAFDNPGLAKGDDHPVTTVNWYDVVKWCNARSEMEGRPPVYYTDAGLTRVYRTGRKPLTRDMINWGAPGYRLPTEAEWEKAARGGLEGHHYPWPSQGKENDGHLDGGKANYAESSHSYQTGDPPYTTPVGYYNGHQTPPGPDMANGFGLYDLAGNVWEWIWDWYLSGWYAQHVAMQRDCRGPFQGIYRVIRGGSWRESAFFLRCAARLESSPTYRGDDVGFRVAVPAPVKKVSTG
ncbi:MAG: SUMF1/EgtB/PvdO family nonheme iron enzyme [Deltaproteobacteria bacterium]|nr:SUMF1/EgtB/PvdO family nonheme iron enzyme [Deltaproteobacteria bacterium]